MSFLPQTQGKTLPDAWDYKGRPAERLKSGGWTAAAMILGVEAMERLTTLGIAVNLVTYLTGTMHLGNATSANTVTNFLGTSFMLCLLGGFVADTFLGRYLTISIFAAVQAAGVTVLTISTVVPSLRPPKCEPGSQQLCVPANNTQLMVLYVALYLTALGTGGLKSSVSGFGSDQFDDSDPEERSQMTNFFNWFFFFISIGSLAAVTVLVYIQDNLGRKWGYGICACAIVSALLVFFAGTKRYRFKKLVGSPLTQIAAVFVAAWRKRRKEIPSDTSFLFNVDDVGDAGNGKKKQKLPHSKQFRFLDKAAIKDNSGKTVMNKWSISTLTDVEEVKLVIRMLPIWATTIIFWTVYAQMTTFSVAQATTMNRHIGKSFQIPAASLTAFSMGTNTGLKKPSPFLGFSITGFGSDQFDDSDPEERSQMTNFFNWFFFFISIGSLAAVTVLVYIQDNLGRKWGYGICACAIVSALLVFFAGTKRYRFKKLVGSPLTQIAAVFVAAWRKRRKEIPSDTSFLFNVDDVGDAGNGKKKQKLPHSKQFRFLDKAAIKDNSGKTVMNKWSISTLTDVEEVKLVIRMLPIWATTIIFWTVYAQMTTFSVAQATTMNRHIGKSFQIPAASLTAFFVASILLTVPVYDRLIVPAARKLLKNPQGLTPLQRIGVGLVLSILAMVAAALTELKRLRVAEDHGLKNDRTAEIPLSVFWLVPQFFLVGAGEAFTYIGQLDFFLRECPKGMKTMSTGLFLSTLSLGFFVSSLLVTIVHKVTGRKPWLADNLNQGKLYDFYWLLAILSGLNFVVYLGCAKWYVYKDKRLSEEGIELEETEPTCHA